MSISTEGIRPPQRADRTSVTPSAESITVLRGQPTPDEVNAINAALALLASQTVREAPVARLWGSPRSTLLGVSQPEPWGTGPGWSTHQTHQP